MNPVFVAAMKAVQQSGIQEAAADAYAEARYFAALYESLLAQGETSRADSARRLAISLQRTGAEWSRKARESQPTYRVELANRIRNGRAVGNLFGIAKVVDGRRRAAWVLVPQASEAKARHLCNAYNLELAS